MKMIIRELEHHLGSTERVHVAHVNDLNDFYLQRETDRSLLIKLDEALSNEYSTFSTGLVDNNQLLRVDDYCACPSEDEVWYRGLIRHIESQVAWVYRIDYGDVQYIPLQYLRPLKERFREHPRLAFNCSLANIIKPVQGWPENVINEFKKSLSTTFLFAQINNYNPIRQLCEVELRERSSTMNINEDFKQHQQADSLVPLNDALIYRTIPMETLSVTEPTIVNLLHYLSPSRFYVYLPGKLEDYRLFHTDLQQTMQMISESPVLRPHRCVAVRDRHMIWHRAIILRIADDSSCMLVYFVDLGFQEVVTMENVRELPHEYFRPTAMAIPCRLFRAFPVYDFEGSRWNLDDPVHEAFHRATSNVIECVVRDVKENLFYDVAINIPSR